MNIKKQFNQATNPKYAKDYETNLLPSMTIPDQSMSIPEIMRRFAAGLSIDNAKIPLYEGEDGVLDGVNLKTLDISERYALVEQKRQELQDIYKRQVSARKPVNPQQKHFTTQQQIDANKAAKAKTNQTGETTETGLDTK